MIRVALAQINTTVGDFTGNQNKIESALEQSKALGVDVVVFPELAICGYPPEDLLHKNHFVEKNLKVLDEIAIKTQGIHAVIGFVQAKDSHIYNAAAIVGNGRIYGVYQKQELPNYGVFDEKRYFEPGHSNGLFSLNGVLIGINICEDIWVDNAGYLQQAKSGASLLINISSSPYEIGKPVVRRDLIVRRAKDTDTFVCYANLVGGQDELVFDGGSFIVDPAGKVVAQAKRFNEDLVVADLPVEARNPSGALSVISLGDSKTVSKCEIEGKNSEVFFIEEDEEVYSALVLGTRDYIKKNGFKKAVIGLSGGIDSALVAAIACDAIGAGNVIGISMPTKFNSKGTRADARKLAENLHMEFHEIPIKKLMTAYEATLDPWFYGRPPDIAEENLQARIRGNIIMAFSNKFGWLVLTTGNKSEMAVGYCTLYGDMSGGFAVIKDILKTRVYELARYKNRKAGTMVIPKSVILRAPSAELRENQKDADSLPEYEHLDKMLESYVQRHESVAQMTAYMSDEKLCRKVVNLVDKSEYKRRQAPPGIKITARAFGKDWRLPITNQYKEL